MINCIVSICIAVLPVAIPAAHADPLRDRPRFVGSAALFPFALEVARRMDRPRAAIGEMTGTTAGFTLFCSGMGTAHPDIALASRDMQPAERALCDAHGVTNVRRAAIGYGALVVAVRKDSKLSALTTRQLWLALARDVPGDDGAFRPNPYQRWSEIDPTLPDLPIGFVVPSSKSGRYDAFAELILQRGCRQEPMVQQIADEAARRRFCARVRPDRVASHTRSDINRIEAMLEGEAGRVAVADLLDYVEHRDAVQAVAIDGASPTQATIADGSYKLAQPLYVFVKMAQLEQINGLDAYLHALFDDAAIGEAGYLLKLGLAPLSPDARAAQRKALFGG